VREDALKAARILVVDDQEANVRLVERILGRAGYENIRSTTDSSQVVGLWVEFDPDLLVLDLMMPEPDGFAVMDELARRVPEGTYLPILVLTADTTNEAKYRALSMGARDFLTKPFDPTEALLRIRNLLEIRLLQRRVEDHAGALEERVRERTSELEEALEASERASEYRRGLLARISVGDGDSPSESDPRGDQGPR
jgi:putative two-component system response regulator